MSASPAARLPSWLFGVLAVTAACGPADVATVKARTMALGDELAGENRYLDAARAYERAVAIDPRDGQARLRLAQVHALGGRDAEAAVEAIRAADLLPHDVGAQLLAARLMLPQARFVDAADRMAAVLRQHPDDVAALVLWGNATARLLNSTWALYRLADAVRSADAYERDRAAVRPPTSREEDRAAEAAFRRALALAPDSFEAQLALVNFLWAAARLDEAEPLLKRAADQNPQHATLNQALGGYYLARHRGAEAERYLRNAAGAAGTAGRQARFALADHYIDAHRDEDALALLGTMAGDDAEGSVTLRASAVEVRQGRYFGALRRLDDLLKRLPHNAAALQLKAEIMFTLKDIDEAELIARAAIAEQPYSSGARLILGRALAARGDRREALEAFREALRLDPASGDAALELAHMALADRRDADALQFAQLAVRRRPGDDRAALALATALVRLRDYSAAERVLRPLLRKAPVPADVLVQLATVQAARGFHAAAARSFTRALEADGSSLDALSGLVSLDMDAKRIPAARRRIETAVAANPRHPGYLLLAANVYLADDDVAAAERTLRGILEIDETNAAAARALSDLLLQRQQFDQARRVLQDLLARAPHVVEARLALGLVLERMGRAAEARTHYEWILADHPGFPSAAQRLAALYVMQGEHLQHALELAIVAKQRLPDDPAVNDTLGWVYVRSDMPELGLPHLRDAVRASPCNAIFRYHLGTAYLRVGLAEEARRELLSALSLNTHLAGEEDAPNAPEGCVPVER